MDSEDRLIHEERPWAGTLLRLTLDPKGIRREEFTSGVPTHQQILPYGEIWDTYITQEFPRWQLAVLAGLTLAWGAAAFFLDPSLDLTALNGAVLGAAWSLLLWRARLRTVKVFDYDGYELAVIHGLPGARFDGFVDQLRARAAVHRYPLQSVFETLDLGRCSVRGWLGSWVASFPYDRVVIERQGPLGRHERIYFSLPALEAPIRLAWRVPWAMLTAAFASAAAAVVLATEAQKGGSVQVWAWWSLGAAVALAASSVLTLGVAVEVAAGTNPLRTPCMPWWKKAQIRETLAWFARIVRLADSLEQVRTEDYWDFHRAKLQILRETGFIDDWPYRSALARLNSQEREELGE